MRRKELCVTDSEKISAIIKRCLYCHLCMVDGEEPYAVPMSFGYDDGVVYLHCAGVGRKLDVLRRNNRVLLSFVAGADLNVPEGARNACALSMHCASVQIVGEAFFVDDEAERLKALQSIIAQYGSDLPLPPGAAKKVMVLKVVVGQMVAKCKGRELAG